MENRRDDWNHSVDSRLVNLTSAQKSADDKIDEIRDELERVDLIIRGNPENKIDGLIEDMHSLQTEINKFNAIFNPDHLGHGGLLSDIKMLVGKRQRSEKREGYFWTFATAFAVQFLILIGLLIVNWDKITMYLRESDYAPSAQMKRQIAQDKKRHRPKPVKAPPIALETNIIKATEPVKKEP